MKKTLIILLSIAVLFGFAACDNTTPSNNEENVVLSLNFADDSWKDYIKDASDYSTVEVTDGVLSLKAASAYFGYDNESTNYLPTEEKSYELSYSLTVAMPADGTESLKFSNPLGSGGIGKTLVLTLDGAANTITATEATSNSSEFNNLGTAYTVEDDSVQVTVDVLYEYVSENLYSVTLSVAYDNNDPISAEPVEGNAAGTKRISWSFYGADNDGTMATATLDSFTISEILA